MLYSLFALKANNRLISTIFITIILITIIALFLYSLLALIANNRLVCSGRVESLPIDGVVWYVALHNNVDDDVDVDGDDDDDDDGGDNDDAHLLLFSPQLPFPAYLRCSSTPFQGLTIFDRPFANKINFNFVCKKTTSSQAFEHEKGFSYNLFQKHT